jgi:hypothetical protein
MKTGGDIFNPCNPSAKCSRRTSAVKSQRFSCVGIPGVALNQVQERWVDRAALRPDMML